MSKTRYVKPDFRKGRVYKARVAQEKARKEQRAKAQQKKADAQKDKPTASKLMSRPRKPTRNTLQALWRQLRK